MSPVLHDIVGLLIVTVVELVVLASAELAKRTSLRREFTRKIAHVGSGLSLLVIPLVIDSHWTVLALSVGFAVLMISTSKLGLLESVHNVGRGVGGVLWYPFTAWLLYVLAFERGDDNWALYVIPTLTLALADAVGAIVGTIWGKHRYDVVVGCIRSLEGSSAFFVTTLLCVSIPLLLTDSSLNAQLVLLSIVVALVCTGVESISTEGRDNIYVPFACAMLLDAMIGFSAQQLLQQLGLVVAASVFIGLVRWRRDSVTGGLVAATLVVYSLLAIGGPPWLIPMVGLLIVFVVYDRWSGQGALDVRERASLETVVAAFMFPMVLMFLWEVVNDPAVKRDIYTGYLAALAANAAVLWFTVPQLTSAPTRLRALITSREKYRYTVSGGTMLAGAVGAAIPVALVSVVYGTGEITVLAMLWALAGLGMFVLVATRIAARCECAMCGTIGPMNLPCCNALPEYRSGARGISMHHTLMSANVFAGAGVALPSLLRTAGVL